MFHYQQPDQLFLVAAGLTSLALATLAAFAWMLDTTARRR